MGETVRKQRVSCLSPLSSGGRLSRKHISRHSKYHSKVLRIFCHKNAAPPWLLLTAAPRLLLALLQRRLQDLHRRAARGGL